MNCDICGKSGILRKALVEGAILNVCNMCVHHGTLLEDKKKAVYISENKEPEIVEIIVPDYDYRIKTKREVLGLSQKQLAFEINEKESVIHLIETGKLKPTMIIIKKLERFLNVPLLVREQDNQDCKIDFKDKSLTIDDLMKLKEDE